MSIDVCCISDMHGNLKFDVPKSDLLLIAGDICPATHDPFESSYTQKDWLENKFNPWLSEQPIKQCVMIAGNHDWIWETHPRLVPWMNFNCCYVEDEIAIMTSLHGLKIYGTPVQLPFCEWAFNREERNIQRYWNNIPEGLDILLLHSPPYGILDETHHPKYTSEHIGSKSLLKRIEEVRPKLVVFGHNHGEHGVVERDGIKYINASLVDEEYKMVREPIVIEIEL